MDFSVRKRSLQLCKLVIRLPEYLKHQCDDEVPPPQPIPHTLSNGRPGENGSTKANIYNYAQKEVVVVKQAMNDSLDFSVFIS